MATSRAAEVMVNGTVIPAVRIAAEAQNHPAPRNQPGVAWRAAARALALREAMVQQARRCELSATPQDLAPGLLETEEEALIRVLLEVAITPEPVDPAELRVAYDADPDRFRVPPLWEAAHILIAAPPDDAAARATARAQAEALLADLLAQPRRFAAIAVEHSACSSRSAGGMLGQIGPGDTVIEFEAALRGLKPGEIAPEPVETRFGLHLVRLDGCAIGDVLPFEMVRPRLAAAAEKAAWVRAAKAFAEDLLARSQVTGLSVPDR